mgnify:CR=1 FL=1
MNYSTKTEEIYEKYTQTLNVVTKWVYKTIIQNRSNAGDTKAKEYLELIEMNDS